MYSYAVAFGYYLLDLFVIFYDVSSPQVGVFMDMVPFLALFFALVMMYKSLKMISNSSNKVSPDIKNWLYGYFSIHALGWAVSLAISVACFFVAPWIIATLSLVNLGLAFVSVLADYYWLSKLSSTYENLTLIGLSQYKKALLFDGLMWLSALGVMVTSFLVVDITLLAASVWLGIVGLRCLANYFLSPAPVEEDESVIHKTDRYELNLEKELVTGEVNLCRVISRHAWMKI